MEIPFCKYQGAGNDFILLDAWSGEIVLSQSQIQRLCDRHFGIGADGLMVIRRHAAANFEMLYYNSDGFQGSMCGNGGRCILQFAIHKGYAGDTASFMAVDGLHEGKRNEDGTISLRMNNVTGMQEVDGYRVMDTGSPHCLIEVADTETIDVSAEGRRIRNSGAFASDGINVNFIGSGNGHLKVRTYERGVEEETLSCGTGVTAAALLNGLLHLSDGTHTTTVHTKGGVLSVKFEKRKDEFTDIWLTGPAVFVFKGSILI